jgi:hypothetical protein
MGLKNYTQLVAAVASWMNRTDLAAQIPDFIAIAEAVINRRIEHRQMIGFTQLGFSGSRVSLPDDFTGWKSGRIVGANQPALQFETLDAYANRLDSGGVPTKYTLADGSIFLDPTPAAAGTIELFYCQQIPPLAENGTNWLLDAFPDVYLYGALAQAMPFMVDDDRFALMSGLFEKAIAEVNADGQQQAFGGTIQMNGGQAGRIYG